MKIYLIPIIILGLYSCSAPDREQTKLQNYQEVNSDESFSKNEISKKKLKFNEVKGQAVIIGEKVKLLDNDLRIVEDISNLNGKVVDIIGVSDSLYNGDIDICDEFWYVKIKTATKEGNLNGRQVFKVQNSKQDANVNIDGNLIEFLSTNFLGMGVEYEGDLVGCPVYQPMLIKDKENDFFGLVDLIPNEYSKNARGGKEYPYFELRSDDGAYDRIDSIIPEETKIRLRIHRSFQEGENKYDVILRFDGSKYNAEYLNFGKVIIK